MEDSELHNRTMNANAHFAWSVGLWGAGEYSRELGNLISACITYYYSAFHALFALMNGDKSYSYDSLYRMGHSQIQSWLENKKYEEMVENYALLRRVRETVNYLGMDTPASKLRIVRGHPFGFDLGTEKLSFTEMSISASVKSKDICHFVAGKYEDDKANPVRMKAYDSNDWVTEYLGEDLFLNVLSDQQGRAKILSLGFKMLDEYQTKLKQKR